MPRPNDRRLAALELAVDELVWGMYRTPDGPGTIRGKAIRPKAISANHIAVSDLESVNASTGNLSVTGSITLTTAGHISAGQDDFNSGTGFWLDNAGGVPRFSIGNGPSGSRITWDGTVLNVAGTITATTGTIGGFTIGAQDLTAGSGSSHIGFSSSGSVRIWSGSETPSAAPFQVSSAGVLTATGATIKSGAGNARAELTAVNGVSVYDSGGTVRGRLSTDGSGFLGSTNGLSTGAAVRWTTGGVATINADAITTGTLNASGITVTNLNASSITAGTLVADRISGGSLGGGISLGSSNVTLNSTGKITWGSGASFIDSSAMTLSVGAGLTSMFNIARSGYSNTVAIQGAIPSGAVSQLAMFVQPGSGGGSYESGVFVNAGGSDGATTFELLAYNSAGTLKSNITGRGDGTLTIGTGSTVSLEIGGTVKASLDSTGFYPRGVLQNDQMASSGGSGAMPNPTKYWAVKSGAGATYYVPVFTSPAPWTA
ncbi:MAG: hypothetical protein IH609_16560 [Dehalococcoidia bacterium]|nr:hypothetical protein [Dehalococcoidia bacterium]